MDPKEVIGLSEEEATRRIEDAGYEARVTRRDDQEFDISMDINDDRINIEVENDQVVSADIG